MSGRPGPPGRDAFAVWRQITTRWADDDAYGHMNNARYYELFDTAVNAFLVEASGTDVRGLDAIGVVAETSCRYFREVGFPEPVEVGLAVERLGRSSVTYRLGIFQGRSEVAAAEGRFVHVYVAREPGAQGRTVRPVPQQVRAVVEKLAGPR